VSLFLGVACTLISGISRRVGDLIMGIIRIIVSLALGRQGADVHPDDIHSQIPVTINTAMKCFALDSKVTVFAVCPVCHCTYKPETTPGLSEVVYPRFCSNMPRPDAVVCGESLLEDGPRHRPLKTFAYHHFDDYLASMLARPDIEMTMDESCSTLAQDPIVVSDVLEATFLRQFCDPDGQLFVQQHNGEGRYVFALNVDYFNPEGLRVRGARNSCGIISMTCLNLPLNIRYKPENMYLAGIIPGPSEPHLTDLNHYLRPLIHDLKVSWERGYTFSRTALHPTGRITRSAIAAVVCDLPAARQAAQMAGHQSHFYCTVCSCHHRSTLGRTDYQDWMNRDVEQMRKHAEMWRDAKTVAEQVKIFNKYGVRWSELWNLPYWDPTRQLVVDSMHCLFEGLVHTHVREILGLSTATASEKEAITFAFHHNFTQPSLQSNSESSSTPRASPAPSQESITSSQRSLTRSQNSVTPSQTLTPPPFHASSALTPKVIDSIALIHSLLIAPVSNADPETCFKDLGRRLSQQSAAALHFVYQNDILSSLQVQSKSQGKRRMIMDAVVVPTLQEVKMHWASAQKPIPPAAGPTGKRQHHEDGSDEQLLSKKVKFRIEHESKGVQAIALVCIDSDCFIESNMRVSPKEHLLDQLNRPKIKRPLRNTMAEAMVTWVSGF
jgi:hypothetical protein